MKKSFLGKYKIRILILGGFILVTVSIIAAYFVGKGSCKDIREDLNNEEVGISTGTTTELAEIEEALAEYSVLQINSEGDLVFFESEDKEVIVKEQTNNDSFFRNIVLSPDETAGMFQEWNIIAPEHQVDIYDRGYYAVYGVQYVAQLMPQLNLRSIAFLESSTDPNYPEKSIQKQTYFTTGKWIDGKVLYYKECGKEDDIHYIIDTTKLDTTYKGIISQIQSSINTLMIADDSEILPRFISHDYEKYIDMEYDPLDYEEGDIESDMHRAEVKIAYKEEISMDIDEEQSIPWGEMEIVLYTYLSEKPRYIPPPAVNIIWDDTDTYFYIFFHTSDDEGEELIMIWIYKLEECTELEKETGSPLVYHKPVLLQEATGDQIPFYVTELEARDGKIFLKGDSGEEYYISEN